jgi:hypothetical protein
MRWLTKPNERCGKNRATRNGRLFECEERERERCGLSVCLSVHTHSNAETREGEKQVNETEFILSFVLKNKAFFETTVTMDQHCLPIE